MNEAFDGSGCFKFGFGTVGSQRGSDAASENAQTNIEAEEVHLSETEKAFCNRPVEKVALGSVSLYKVLLSSLETSKLLSNSKACESDLIPELYEGGFKLWEGAIDLGSYLAAACRLSEESLRNMGDQQQEISNPLKGMKVMELGCGHGLPGILCVLAGAEVHFQAGFQQRGDCRHNIPNLEHNVQAFQLPTAESGRARFFSGSWGSLPALLTTKGLEGSYDLVLSAETIYSEASQGDLLDCIVQLLAPGRGVALVAAKAFYFGVGGGTAGFRRLAQRRTDLRASVLAVLDDGASTKREIMLLHVPGRCPSWCVPWDGKTV
eukprot:jgi/Botrbrau1/20689/Bobra.0058s0019.1